MKLMCVQCAMTALVEGKEYRPISETVSEHLRRCHPHGFQTTEERKELEHRAVEVIKRKGK